MARDDDKFDKDKHDDDTEYQFNDDQESSNYEYEENSGDDKNKKKPTQMLANKQTRMIIIIVVALVIIFVLFKVFHSSNKAHNVAATNNHLNTMPHKANFNPSISKATTMPAMHTETKTSAVAPFKASSMPAAATKTAKTASTQALFQQEGQQQALKAKVTELKKKEAAQLAKLQQQQQMSQTQLMNLRSQLTTLNSQISSVNQNLSTVSQNIQKIQSRQAREQAQKAAGHRREQKTVRQHKHYFVDAVIPGRAWLKGEDGTTVTVAVGDKLPGYGTITEINPYSGVVMTSKGAIPYGVSGG